MNKHSVAKLREVSSPKPALRVITNYYRCQRHGIELEDLWQDGELVCFRCHEEYLNRQEQGNLITHIPF